MMTCEVRVIEGFDYSELEKLGYSRDIMEGAYISSDGTTIVIKSCRNYAGQVLQYTQDEEGHLKNLEELKARGFLEVEGKGGEIL